VYLVPAFAVASIPLPPQEYLMAQAPDPGFVDALDDDEQLQTILSITIHRDIVSKKGRPIPRTHQIAINLVSVNEKLVVRRSTGLPFEAYWDNGLGNTVGEDSLVVLWWLARRANGERGLNWSTAADEWPKGMGEDDFDVEVDEPDSEASDPEA